MYFFILTPSLGCLPELNKMHNPGGGVPLYFSGGIFFLNINIAVLTVSDRSAKGERVDLSGEVIVGEVKKFGANIICKDIVPDEREKISEKLMEYCDDPKINLILTTGGTGLSPRDITPEATKDIIEKEAPGFVEAIRLKSLEITEKTMLSRAVAGIRNQTLIINMPGSPKAVKENLDIIKPVLPHAIETLLGDVTDCGKEDKQS